MTDRKPIVLGPDPTNPSETVLQQVQPSDQVDPATLPFDRETNLRRLFRLLLIDLMSMGIVVNQELIDEASKQG